MPLKLNVGLSKKVGLPRYGSLGASCNVEVKLDASLLASDPEAFRAAVRRVYEACARAVNEQLARQQSDDTTSPPLPESDDPTPDGNGQGAAGHCATQKQLDYASHLAAQIHGLGARKLETLVVRMFSKPSAGLTSLEASGLIDTLKAIKDGQIDLQAALTEAA